MQIGSVTLQSTVIAAPMAGVSDKPYRALVRSMGAGMAVSEMLTSKLQLRHTSKTRFRMDIHDEQAPVSVQLVGTDPDLLAEAAQVNANNGADIIDINMGCPAKKVCKKLAGSALLGDEALVKDILNSVVAAVDIPVTLKIRTGLTPEDRNAVKIAEIAESTGIQALTIHGRTRQCRFNGSAEYETITEVKQAVGIPIIANGDIDSPQKALAILEQTNVDAVMIGRAAQGRPWLFRQIIDFLSTGKVSPEPNFNEKKEIILQHIHAIHAFYGEYLGVKFACKHITWYLNNLSKDLKNERSLINQQDNMSSQIDCLEQVLMKISSTNKFQPFTS